jgi:hypothetical protein
MYLELSERPETCFRWDGSIILFVLSFIEVTIMVSTGQGRAFSLPSPRAVPTGLEDM